MGEMTTGATELITPLSAWSTPPSRLPTSDDGPLNVSGTPPEPVPSVPPAEGSAAFAAPTPANEIPPSTAANISPLDTHFFMTFP
ncbi:hypothetical protein GCM10027415_36780 [Humibacter ginsengisoli]